MNKRIRRKNQKALDAIQATLIALVPLFGIAGSGIAPRWLAVAAGIATGATTYFSKEVGAVIALLGLALPVIAGDALTGVVFTVVSVIVIRYLEQDGPRTLLAGAAAVFGALYGPVWAAPVIAGYALTRSSGPVVAAMACVALEAYGLVLGKDVLGGTAIGAHRALVDLDAMHSASVSLGWAKDVLGGISTKRVDEVVKILQGTSAPLLLAIQPAVWAAGAWGASRAGRFARRRSNVLISAAAGAAAGLGLSLASGFALAAGDHRLGGGFVIAAVSSVLASALIAAAWDRLFPVERTQTAKKGSTSALATEDADVDELLSLIASAEEKLATQHAASRVVLITDMKSFSKMTEEDGSMLTAKAIQKHRDLLLPIVARHNGKGKSTGGDGLLAAFESADEAVKAAVEMQCALHEHNVTHPHQREMTIRIGIAQGEVMLDRNGRPFIGVALNLAARVMNLADGGQAFVTSYIAAGAPESAKYHSHGEFELKNIAKPVEVLEIIWRDDLEPVDPRTREA